MYSKEQSSQLRHEFWTTFGQYISPILSSGGLKVNWINYRTGFRHIAFKMNALNRSASIGIELSHPDTGIQELFFEQFLEFKNILHSYLGEEWTWELHHFTMDGKTISRIYTEIKEVSIFNKSDWPVLISFFKPRIIALDEFWNDVKDGFEALK